MIEMTDKDGKKWMVDARYATEKKEPWSYEGKYVTGKGLGPRDVEIVVSKEESFIADATTAFEIMDALEGWLNHVE